MRKLSSGFLTRSDTNSSVPYKLSFCAILRDCAIFYLSSEKEDTVQPHYNAIFGVHGYRPCYNHHHHHIRFTVLYKQNCVIMRLLTMTYSKTIILGAMA